MTEITHLSQYATQRTNTAGKREPILEYQPENGTVAQIKNAVAKGREAGVPIYFKFRGANGNPLPDDTEVLLRVDVPSKTEPLVVSEKLKNISSWNAISIGDQRNEENIDQLKLELEGRVINIRHFDTLTVELKSSAVIDWANSEFYVDGKATRTVPYN
jgi:hypothetical protein